MLKCQSRAILMDNHIGEIAKRVHITSAIRAMHLVISNVQVSVSRFSCLWSNTELLCNDLNAFIT